MATVPVSMERNASLPGIVAVVIVISLLFTLAMLEANEWRVTVALPGPGVREHKTT